MSLYGNTIPTCTPGWNGRIASSIRNLEDSLTFPIKSVSSSRLLLPGLVEGFRNQINTEQPTVVFRAAGKSQKEESGALLMQRWGYGQLRKERETAIVDPTLQNGFDLLLRGGACCKKIVVDVDCIDADDPPRRGNS